MPGRPRALDDIKKREVVPLISAGCGLETAANYVGCSPRTITRETRRYKEFWEQFRKAELASTLSPLQTIQQAAHSNWRAATWLLERKLPQYFAPTHRDMIDPNDLGQIFDRFMDEINRSIPDHETRQRVLRGIERATVTAIHEATTKRKNPKIRPRKSSLRNLFLHNDELDDDQNPLDRRPHLPPLTGPTPSSPSSEPLSQVDENSHPQT